MAPIRETSHLQRLLGYLERDPGNLRLIADAASAAIDEGEPDEAEALLERYAKLASLPPELINLQGLAAMGQQRFDQAGAIFETLLRGAPSDQALRFNLAWCRAMAADFTAANALLDDRTASSMPAAATLKVQALHHLGKLDEALAIGAKLAERFPADKELLGKLANVALDAEDLALAESYASRAGAQHDALAASGMLRLNGNRAAEAATLFDKALRLDPSDARALLGKGLTLMALGRTREAADLIDRAAERFERHLGSWVAAGWTYFVLGDLGTARARFERARAIDDTFAEIHGGLAVLDVVEGHLESAKRRTEVALRLDRKCFSAALANSMMLEGGGERAAAQRVRNIVLNAPLGPGGRTLAEAMAAMGLGRTTPRRR